MKNNYTQKQIEQVCDIVYNFMTKHKCQYPDQAMQSDEINIDAIELVCDLSEIVGYNIQQEQIL